MTHFSKMADERKPRIPDILSDPDYMTPKAMAQVMGLAVPEVVRGAELEFLIAVDCGSDGLRLPAWQLGDDKKPLAGLEELMDEFSEAFFKEASLQLICFLRANKDWVLTMLREGKSQEALGIASEWLRGAR